MVANDVKMTFAPFLKGVAACNPETQACYHWTPESAAWSALPNMLFRHHQCELFALSDDSLIITMSRTPHTNSKVEIFKNGNWSEKAEFPIWNLFGPTLVNTHGFGIFSIGGYHLK